MIASDGKVVCALVLGSNRASTERVSKVLNIERPDIAAPEQALEKTGYLVGGTPPFGYEAVFLIDDKIMEKDTVYAGGGTPNALVKISPKEIQRINHGIIARVRK
jgi:prolyl-tRNA editing enzyme YbaK/EbsC (Cys-tRNA(Pro) deacylase)